MPASNTTRGMASDEALRDSLVDAFRKKSGEATTADLVAATGLPLSRVEAALPSVSDEYGARLRVTESGEVLYSFPRGLHSRYRGFGPSLRRFWKSFKKGALEAAKLLFKGWIVLMLVGYFVLFILLAIVAFLASIALQSSGRGDRDDRGGGLGGLFLTGRLLNSIMNIWFYSEIFKDPNQRSWEASQRAQKSRDRRPLHKAVFSFVFGEGDPNADRDELERKAVVAWLQTNRGIMTMSEFRALTGLSPLEADERINVYLRDFQGRPEASENGTLYFAFPDLLRHAERAASPSLPYRRLKVFSANKGRADFWFGAINLVNLAFGSYFLINAASPHHVETYLYKGRQMLKMGGDFMYVITSQLATMAGIANPAPLLAVALGFVPISFALLFFAIPAIRKLRLARENEALKVGNLRTVLYRAVLDRPEGVKAASIVPNADEARPADLEAGERILTQLAAADGGEPAADGTWSWPSVLRAKKDAAKLREAVKPGDFALGKTVFDSDAKA